MIYADIEKIYRERNIPNKYILTLLVAARARQLSEQKGTTMGGEIEKFISRAMDDVAEGRVQFKLSRPQETPEAQETAHHVSVEN